MITRWQLSIGFNIVVKAEVLAAHQRSEMASVNVHDRKQNYTKRNEFSAISDVSQQTFLLSNGECNDRRNMLFTTMADSMIQVALFGLCQ